MTDKTNYEPDTYMSGPEEGLLLQVRTTYRIKNGKVEKHSITRRYWKDGDYQDSTSSEILDVTQY